MAAAPSELTAGMLALCALLSLCGLVSESSAQGTNGGTACVDGTYEHDERLCCLCGTGQYLKVHCTANLQYGKCELCPDKTYSVQPNHQKSCEPCSSCSHPHANLEVKEACTPARDATCRCKKDHYCSSGGTEKCRICQPCDVCPEGIKVACTANNNTVCDGKQEERGRIGVFIALALALVVLGLVFFLIKRYRTRNRSLDVTRAPDAELQPLTAPAVDLQRHLPDIAEIIGWKDMRVVALRSGIQNPVIESCQLNHPNDCLEQTLELLNKYVEGQGREASTNLVKILEKSKKRDQAERIIELLSRHTS